MQGERRQTERFKQVFRAINVFVDNFVIPWELVDISSQGLSFQYSPIIGENMKSDMIHIIDSEHSMEVLLCIFCAEVYDAPVMPARHWQADDPKRRRGLKYIGLTEEQRRVMDLLLNDRRLVMVSEVSTEWQVRKRQVAGK